MAPTRRDGHAGHVTASDDEVIDVLAEFGAAFAAQDSDRLRALFVDQDVCFVASEDLVLHDRAHLEGFFEAYSAQPVSFSFEWDSCQVSASGESGWVVAFGREIRHRNGVDSATAFRMTLACRRTAEGWRIAHLHASTPDDH